MAFAQVCSRIGLAAALLLQGASVAWSQSSDAGKPTYKLIIGTGPGGSYDTIGRMVAHYMSKYLPGQPTIVASNVIGATGLIAANYLYNIAAQDGTAFGVVPPEFLFRQMFGDKNARFDASKFNWIGNPLGSGIVAVVLDTAPVKNWREAKEKEVLMGGSGPSAPDTVVANLANGTLGTKFKIVIGYPAGQDIVLAMERGEVQGRTAQSWAGWMATNPDWVANKRIVPLFQVAMKPVPELPDVPLLIDIVEGSEAKEIVRAFTSVSSMQRPFFAPPGVPPQQVEQLRAAFESTMQDKEFQAEAQKRGLDLAPISGVALEKMVHDALALDPQMIKKLEKMISP